MSADNNVGWKCPVCGRGVSPMAAVCEHGQSSKTIGAAIKILASQAATDELDLKTGKMRRLGRNRRKPAGSKNLPKGTLRRWVLQQEGIITTPDTALGVGTSIAAAGHGLAVLTKQGYLEKLEKGKWRVTAKGHKEAAKTPTGVWQR